MTHGGSVRVLLFIGSNLLLFSYKACEEGSAHDYSCVPSETSPPFLDFGEWISVGIFMFVVGLGFMVSAFMVFTLPLRKADHLVTLQLENRQKIEN